MDQYYDYLNLENYKGPSGVPFGGIGVGYFQIAPEGKFQRICLNNFHRSISTSDGQGFFLALWQDDGRQATVRSLRRTDDSIYGMPGFDNTNYTGLFPRAEIDFYNDSSDGLNVNLEAYSGLIPHNVKDSSLPIAWIEIELENEKNTQIDVSTALSWEDIISRDILDIISPELLPEENHQLNPVHGDAWDFMDPVKTEVEKYEKKNWQGLRQYATEEVLPEKLTYQNYNNQVAILAENLGDREVSVLPAYQKGQGKEAWSNFKQKGEFAADSRLGQLSNPDSEERSASAVAIKTSLKPGQKKTLRFMVTWYQPDNLKEKLKKQNKDEEWRTFGTADYGRYYHNYFSDFDALVSYGIEARERIYKEVLAWQKPILDSNMPDWLQFKVINSAYAIYANSVLNKAGVFTQIEGMMGGLGGTIDQRNASYPFYQKFFPELDRTEMKLYDVTREEGKVMHYILHYYAGIANFDGTNPVPGGHLIDNSMGWIIMLANDYKLHGDRDYIKEMEDGILTVYNYFKEQIPGKTKAKGTFLQPAADSLGIPEGGHTYDDFEHPPVNSYNASMYLATLKAFQKLGQALEQKNLIEDAQKQFEQTQQGYINSLWNGEYFAIGCNRDGSNRRDDIMFTGQLAGQFNSRRAGFGDIIAMDKIKSSFEHQINTSVKNSPEYYAYKYWDVEEGKGLDGQGSRCWPFYLDNYTGMLGIQAGYVQDGLEVLKKTLLVQHSRGYTWSQNLWNPDFETYMTVPAAWSVNDVLAGASYDRKEQKLTLGPTVIPGEQLLSIPLYYAEFWLQLYYDKKSETARVEVIKTWDQKNYQINKIAIQPPGISTDKQEIIEIPGFKIEEGAVLDLTPYWTELDKGEIHAPIFNDRPREVSKMEDLKEFSGQGTGLNALYFNDPDFEEFKFSLVNDRIDFDWGMDSPGPEINGDDFSVQWTGFFEPQYSQRYIFTTQSEGAVKVWLDGQKIIDEKDKDHLVEANNDMWLNVGQKYPFKVKYSSKKGPAKIKLKTWCTSEGEGIISRSQLYPAFILNILDYDQKSGTQKEGNTLAFIEDGDYVIYKNVEFGDQEVNKIKVKAASETKGGKIELRLDAPDGELKGTVDINGTSGWNNWQEFSSEINKLSGRNDICLVFVGDDGYLFNLDWIVWV